MTQVGQVKNLKDYFRNTKKRREFFGGHELVAYDVGQILGFEAAYAKSSLGKTSDGLPPTEVLMTAWWRTRDSWQRIMLALPDGPDRDEMLLLLAERDLAMERLREKARSFIRIKEARGDVA